MKQLTQIIDVKPTQRAFIVGTTGSGKSVLSRALLSDYPFVIAIDEKGDFKLPDEMIARNPDDLPRLADQQLNHPYRPVVFRPDPEYAEPDVYDEVFKLIYRRQNTTLYLDEVYAVLKNSTPPRYLTAILTRGRSLGIRFLGASQRPSRIPLFLLSEAEHYIMFRLKNPDDVDRMADYMGPEVESPLPLTRFHAFYYHNIFRPGVRTYELENRPSTMEMEENRNDGRVLSNRA